MYTTFEVRVSFDDFETAVVNTQEQWVCDNIFPAISVARKLEDLVKHYGTTAQITITSIRQ